MPDTRTIAQLESERYDLIAAECCRGTVWIPFRMIRSAHPDWPLSTMTLDDIGPKLRSEGCGGRPARHYPIRQEDGPGFARKF